MVILADYKSRLMEQNPDIPENVAEAIVVLFCSSFPDSFGYEFMSDCEKNMMETTYTMGDKTEYIVNTTDNGTVTKTITISRDFSDENPNQIGTLIEVTTSSMFDHWKYSNGVLIEQDGLAMNTYDINSANEETESSAVGKGLNEGVKSYLAWKSAFDNYTNYWSSPDSSIYLEVIGRYLMETGFSNSILTSMFSGDITHFKTALIDAGIDFDQLISETDLLYKAEKKRKDGSASRDTVQEIFVGISPILMALNHSNNHQK